MTFICNLAGFSVYEQCLATQNKHPRWRSVHPNKVFLVFPAGALPESTAPVLSCITMMEVADFIHQEEAQGRRGYIG